MPDAAPQTGPAGLAGLTLIALIAFAANSVLCRMALLDGAIDPASFTTARVLSGALTLVGLVAWQQGRAGLARRPDWRTGLALMGYMVCFSFAYVALGAGTGALVLFGFVQFTMLAIALARGEPFPPLAWLGLALSVAGVLYLVRPGDTAPDAMAALLMAAAGVSWGLYSVLGRGSRQPLADTAGNFLFCVPLVLLLSLALLGSARISGPGLALAIASGALASGCGYAIWYRVLPHLSTAGASVLQLSVPVLAALGGVLLLDEPLSLRLILSSALVLGGIWLVLHARKLKN